MKTKPAPQQSACLALRHCPHCRYYPFAPGAIEYQPRRRYVISRHALMLVAACLVTVAAVFLGLLLGGVL